MDPAVWVLEFSFAHETERADVVPDRNVCSLTRALIAAEEPSTVAVSTAGSRLLVSRAVGFHRVELSAMQAEHEQRDR